MKGRRGFFAAVLSLTLLIAGGLSYLASSSPDGLDAATLRGCEIGESDSADTITGDCIARSATDHSLAGSPLADYAVAGIDGSGGAAGVTGALLTLLVAGAVFRLISRRGPRRDDQHRAES